MATPQFIFVVWLTTPLLTFAQEKSTEAQAIEKVERLGGKVIKDINSPGEPVVGVDFSQSNRTDKTRFNDKYLHLLQSFTNLAMIDLTNAPLTDDGIDEIVKLKSLKTIRLSGTKISDAGLLKLTELQSLKRLELWDKRIFDPELHGPLKLPDLKTISNMTTLATQEGIDKLKESMPRLEIPLPPQGICSPNQIAFGDLHTGAIAEASVRIFLIGDETIGLETRVSPPPFVRVVRTMMGTQKYGNLGTFIYCDVIFSVDTTQTGDLSGLLRVQVAEKSIDVLVSAHILQKDPKAIRVLIAETPFQRFSTSDSVTFDPWRKLVNRAGLDVNYLEVNPGTPVLRELNLSDYDVILLGGTGIFSAQTQDFERLTQFVDSGGRAIISANSFFQGTVAKANELIVPLGLKMGDTEPPANKSLVTASKANIHPHSLTTGVHELKFFRPSPIALEGATEGKLLIEAECFPQQGLVAVVRVGKGDIVVLGISLWWNWIASEFESGADNARLLENIFTERVTTTE